MKNWQATIRTWVVKMFGEESMLPRERSLRFLEEAIELGQTQGIKESEIFQLVGRVYAKPVGDPPQEVGGVFITFLALCSALDIDAYHAFIKEWDRCNNPQMHEKMQLSQKNKLEAGL